MKQIVINCSATLFLPLDQMDEFQGDLKDLMEIDYQKMRKTILTLGIIDSFNVWLCPDDQRYKILDGHQRKRTLQKMAKEGFQIPDMPVTVVQAKDRKAAKAAILSLTSSFGTLTSQGLYEFMSTSDLDFNDLNNYRLPEINLEKFAEEFGDLPKLSEQPSDKKPEPPPIDEQWIVSASCNNEADMQALFEELQERGYNVKLIT